MNNVIDKFMLLLCLDKCTVFWKMYFVIVEFILFLMSTFFSPCGPPQLNGGIALQL